MFTAEVTGMILGTISEMIAGSMYIRVVSTGSFRHSSPILLTTLILIDPMPFIGLIQCNVDESRRSAGICTAPKKHEYDLDAIKFVPMMVTGSLSPIDKYLGAI